MSETIKEQWVSIRNSIKEFSKDKTVKEKKMCFYLKILALDAYELAEQIEQEMKDDRIASVEQPLERNPDTCPNPRCYLGFEQDDDGELTLCVVCEGTGQV